jgi:hypothetical protein
LVVDVFTLFNIEYDDKPRSGTRRAGPGPP